MEFGDVFDPLSYHLNNRLKNRDGFHVIVFAFSPVKKLCLFCKGRGEKSKQSKTNLKNTNQKKYRMVSLAFIFASPRHLA